MIMSVNAEQSNECVCKVRAHNDERACPVEKAPTDKATML